MSTKAIIPREGAGPTCGSGYQWEWRPRHETPIIRFYFNAGWLRIFFL